MNANDRALKIINGYTTPDERNAASNWFDCCNSPTAFLKSWHLGREVRKLSFFIAGKTRTGLVTAGHVALAIQRLARRMKPKKMQAARDKFIATLLVFGAWALRIAAEFLDGIPLMRGRSAQMKMQAAQLTLF